MYIVQKDSYLMKIIRYVMIIEKFFVAIDQSMNVEMIHVKYDLIIYIQNILIFVFLKGIGQPNGWYAEIESQCRVYYLCTEQRKSKMGECAIGLKWNSQKHRCEDSRNILAPCKIY